MKNFTTCCILLLSATMAQAADEYYVWVDENGITNYSQEYPEGRDAIHVTNSRRFGQQLQTEPADQAQGASRPGTNPAAGDGSDPMAVIDQQAEGEREKILAQIKETKRKNCEIGKRNLANLQVFSRIRVKGENGEEKVLTEEEKAKRTEQARQTIKENCS
jgi:hypothetical protein